MTLSYRLIRDLTLFALVFQVVHLVEHVAQLGYWFVNPANKPWLTPWAEAGRNVLAVDGNQGAGNEMLHLVGNLIFLGGLIGMVVLAKHAGFRTGQIESLNPAVYLQGFHVVEHLMLTGSYLIWGRALGLTTLFGAATGAFGSSLRVWAHFILNLVATYFALRAGRAMYRLGFRAEDNHRTAVGSLGRRSV